MPRTGSPAASLSPNSDSSNRDAVLSRKFDDALGQLALRQNPKMAFNPQTQRLVTIAD
jgi:hypothetical protein